MKRSTIPLLALLFCPTLADTLTAQTFSGPITSIFSHASVRSTSLTDLDEDGNVDIVLSAGAVPISRLHYHLGDGTGRFGPRRTLDSTFLTVYSTTGDVDADGNVDVLVSNPTGSYTHFGDGAGNLGPRVTTGPVYKPDLIDIDGDAWADLVGTTPNNLGELRVLRGDGTGLYSLSWSFPLSGSLSSRHVADVEGDGDPDLVIVTNTIGGVGIHILRHMGSGAPVLENHQAFPGDQAGASAVADFDEDGLKDLFLLQGMDFYFLRGSSGGFLPPVRTTVAERYRSLDATDIDADGHQDLIRTTLSEPLAVALGNGDGTLRPWMSQSHIVQPFPLLADVTRDGRQDLVYYSSDRVIVYRLEPASHAGVVPYGIGTQDCIGQVTAGANGSPAVGNAGFRMRFANAPADSRGIAAIGGPRNAAGYQAFGVLMHTGAAFCWSLGIMDVDRSGVCSIALPIPASATLAGASLYAQGVFLANFADGSTCTLSPFGFVSSRGLGITVQ